MRNLTHALLFFSFSLMFFSYVSFVLSEVLRASFFSSSVWFFGEDRAKKTRYGIEADVPSVHRIAQLNTESTYSPTNAHLLGTLRAINAMHLKCIHLVLTARACLCPEGRYFLSLHESYWPEMCICELIR